MQYLEVGHCKKKQKKNKKQTNKKTTTTDIFCLTLSKNASNYVFLHSCISVHLYQSIRISLHHNNAIWLHNKHATKTIIDTCSIQCDSGIYTISNAVLAIMDPYMYTHAGV